MSTTSKRVAAIGIAALSAGLIALWAQPTSSFASDSSGTVFAQAREDLKGKSDGNTGRPGNQAPNSQPQNQAPISGGQPPSPVLQNAPQSGVPARCASIADATERQKCMNTPKGQ